jgi:hypothetical protein
MKPLTPTGTTNWICPAPSNQLRIVAPVPPIVTLLCPGTKGPIFEAKRSTPMPGGPAVNLELVITTRGGTTCCGGAALAPACVVTTTGPVVAAFGMIATI